MVPSTFLRAVPERDPQKRSGVVTRSNVVSYVTEANELLEVRAGVPYQELVLTLRSTGSQGFSKRIVKQLQN